MPTQKCLTYQSESRLACGNCLPATVILCINAQVVANKLCFDGETDQPFTYTTIEASVTAQTKVKGACNTALWRYTICYDEDLIVEGYTLVASDISGIFCKGCLAQWVEDLVGNEIIVEADDEAGTVSITSQHGCVTTFELDPVTPSQDWTLLGNAGTVDGTNFLGTTDDVPFDIRVNNERSFRIQQAIGGSSPNIIGGHADNTIDQTGSYGNVICGGGYSGGGNLISSGGNGGCQECLIGSGSENVITNGAYQSWIGGGASNSINNFDFAGVILGGTFNSITQSGISGTSGRNFIGNGSDNSILNSDSCSILNGQTNSIEDASYASILGGNTCTISGGAENSGTAFSYASSISGTDFTSGIVACNDVNIIEGAGQSFLNFSAACYDVDITDTAESAAIATEFTTIDSAILSSTLSCYRCGHSGGFNNSIISSEDAYVTLGNYVSIIASDAAVIGNSFFVGMLGTFNSSFVGTSYYSAMCGSSGAVIETTGSDIEGNFTGPVNQALIRDTVHCSIDNGIGMTIDGGDGFSTIINGRHLKLGAYSVGFGYHVGALTEADLSAFDSIGYWGDIDTWVANTDGTARKLKLIEPNTNLDFSTANYTSFEAQAQAANIEYKMPAAAGSVGQYLKIQGIAGNIVTLEWGT